MFYYLKGRAAHLAPNLAVIDCGGVGYACRTTSYTLSGLQMGQEVTLYTHLNVREDAMELYGFGTEKERNCFQLLIGVSGVGPKAALSILSATTPEGLATAIITGDEKALTVAQGIGKKIAQRILLELKDKLAKGQLPAGEGQGTHRLGLRVEHPPAEGPLHRQGRNGKAGQAAEGPPPGHRLRRLLPERQQAGTVWTPPQVGQQAQPEQLPRQLRPGGEENLLQLRLDPLP